MPKDLSSRTYLNPSYIPDGCDANFVNKTRASGIAYQAQALVMVAAIAMRNGEIGIDMDKRGIEQTLDVVAAMLGDLLEHCERLEAATAT